MNDISVTLSADDRALLQTLREAGVDIQQFARKGAGALRELEDSSRTSATGIEKMAGGMKTAFVGGSVAAAIITIKNAIGDVTVAMIDAQMQADKVKNSLTFAMGGPQAAQEIDYLRQVTDKLGVSFAAVAPMYGRLAAATKGTNLEGRATREIFESIAQASVVMGLGVEETEGAMRALVQMVSKGQIQAEELRGQLGERLPRAFQLFAQSMGVTTAELSKLLEAGKVAPDVLAQFAATLKSELAGSLDVATTRLAAGVNRMGNEWLRLKQNIGEAGVSRLLSDEATGIANYMDSINAHMEQAAKRGSGAWGQMSEALGYTIARAPFDALAFSANLLNGTINTMSGGLTGLRTNINLVPSSFEAASRRTNEFASELPKAEAALARLRELDAMPMNGNYFKEAIKEADQYVRFLREAVAAKAAITGGNPTVEGIRASGIAREKYMEQQAKDAKELADIKAKLMGVDKDYLTTLTKLKEMYRSGVIPTEKEYVALVTELAKKNYTAAKSTAAHADGLEDVRAAAKVWADVIKDADKNLLDATGATDELTKSEKRLQEYLESFAYSKNSEEMRKVALEHLNAAIAAERQSKAIKAVNANEEAYAKMLDGHAKEIDSMVAANEALRLQNELIGLSTDAVSALTLARMDAAIEEQKIAIIVAKSNDIGQARIAQMERELVLLEQRRILTYDGQRATATSDAAKRDLEALADLWKSFDNTAHDVFVNIFNDGSNAFKKLGQSLKAGLIDVLYQLTLKRWIISIGASVSGVGGSTLANAAGSGSNLLSGASTLAGLAGGFNTASTMGAFGSGFVGSAASTLGFAEAGSTLAASSAASTAAGFGGASSAGAALGAVAPYLAAAIAIYTIAKKLDHSGTPHIGAGTSYSAAAGLAQASAGASGGGLFSGITYSDSTQQMTTSLVQSIVGILDTTAVAFGKSAGYQAAASFADDSSKDGAWGSLVISKLGEVVSGWAVWAGHGQVFSDGAAGSAEYLAKVTADVRTALDQIGLPGWATAMLDKLGASPTLDQLAATVAEINKTETALVSMGKVLVGFSGMSDGAVSALIKAAGGIDALSAAAATYYDNFYTDAEKTANTTESVRAALAAVGLQMPATRAEFRALVEAQQALGEAGAPALATLLQMAGTFASVVPAASDLTTAVDDAGTAIVRTASDIADSIKNLKATGASLQVDLLTAQGDTQGAARLQRSIDIEGLTAEEVALYDFNAQIRALIETTKAATEAARAEAAQKTSLENTLLQALGETGTLRQRELAALPPANQALQNMIYTVTDAQSAITALNTDIARLDQIARQASTLSNSLSVLLGGNDNTEASLWATVNSASATAEDKLAAISQLMGIINNSITADTQAAQQLLTDGANAARTAIEQANAAQQSGAQAQLAAAQELVDFGRQLSDYVRSLQLGNVSTLTPGEKLAMAAQQYQSSLAGARTGDAAAMQALQGNASTYLELARQYDPAAYSGSGGIFASVTGTLGSFGGSLLTEGQQAALTAQATLDSIKSVSSSSATTANAVITGNVISDANRQSLQTLLDLSTQIEADAVIERAAKEAQRTEETARMEAIRTYLSDSGVIASSVSSTASVMSAFAMQQKADNANLTAQVADLTANVQSLQATIVEMTKVQVQVAQDVGNQVAETVSSAVATAIDEAAGIPVTT